MCVWATADIQLVVSHLTESQITSRQQNALVWIGLVHNTFSRSACVDYLVPVQGTFVRQTSRAAIDHKYLRKQKHTGELVPSETKQQLREILNDAPCDVLVNTTESCALTKIQKHNTKPLWPVRKQQTWNTQRDMSHKEMCPIKCQRCGSSIDFLF